jgi:SOS-response transcriptional repressor LexA
MENQLKPLGQAKCRVLRALHELGGKGVSLSQLATKLNRTNSTVHSTIWSLNENKPPCVNRHRTNGLWELTDAGKGAVQVLLSIDYAEEEEEQTGIEYWGKIAAGPAIALSPNVVDKMPIFDLVSEEHFALHVSGESMVDYGIYDRDLIVLRQVNSWLAVKVNDIVALRVPEGTAVISEDAIEEMLMIAEDASDPPLDHGTLKKITGSDFLRLMRNAEQGQIQLSATGSGRQVVRAMGFDVIGVLVRIQRDIR